MTLTLAQRTLRARLGGLTTSARGHVNTGPARAAFLSRFEAEVDPDRVLSPAERARRAEAARKLHMTKLSFASSRVRGKRKAGAANVSPAPAEEARRDRGEPPAA